MSLTEKTAYLRGLMDGMGLQAETSDERKLLAAIVDVLDDIAANVEANNESITSLADELDELDDAVTELEEILEDDDDEDDEDEDDEDWDDDFFEVECPTCGAEIDIDEPVLEAGEVVCPSCGDKFAVDLSDEEEDDE